MAGSNKQRLPLWLRMLAKIMRSIRNPELPAQPKTGKWYRVTMPGLVASEGSQYFFNLRKGTVDNILIFLHGGGVSWNEHMAARPTTLDAEDFSDCYYFPTPSDYGATGSHGILSFREDNPFKNWSVISLPYCTGDFHCGTGDFQYTAKDGSKKILHHHGYTNAVAAVKKAIEVLGVSPERLLVTGNSAGGFGTALMTASFVELFPNCPDVTCFVDSGFDLLPDAHRIARDVWHAPGDIVERIQSDDITLESLKGLRDKYGARVKILFCCSIRDLNLAQIKGYSKIQRLYAGRSEGEAFQRDLKTMCTGLMEAIPDASIFIFDTPVGDPEGQKNGLTRHCIVIDDVAYTIRVEEKTVMEWLWNSMNGNPSCIGLDLLC